MLMVLGLMKEQRQEQQLYLEPIEQQEQIIIEVKHIELGQVHIKLGLVHIKLGLVSIELEQV